MILTKAGALPEIGRLGQDFGYNLNRPRRNLRTAGSSHTQIEHSHGKGVPDEH